MKKAGYLFAYSCAAVYGLVNASAYSRSLYDSAEQFDFPPAITWFLISVFSLGLTSAITSGYSKSNTSVLEGSSCCQVASEEEPLNIQRRGGPVTLPALGQHIAKSCLKDRPYLKAWVMGSEKVGAVGKAVISNTSLFYFLQREIGDKTQWTDMHIWLPAVSLAFTFPSTIFSQYAVLKRDKEEDSLMKQLISWVAKGFSPAALARFANIPGTFMYFDTARVLFKKAGWLVEDYQPWPLILVLGLFSFSLLIAGDYKFEKDIAAVANKSGEIDSIESKMIECEKFYVGKIMNVGSAVMKSFTGELALLLAVRDLTKQHLVDGLEDVVFASIVLLTAVPLFVTMFSYFVAQESRSRASSTSSDGSSSEDESKKRGCFFCV